MAESSDSEEFYDAEEFTPIKGSKRLSKSGAAVTTETSSTDTDKLSKTEETASLPTIAVAGPARTEATPEDDRTTVKNVVSGRRKFQELRRCMQAEEEDEGTPTTDHHYGLEQPFKIISTDTMSLQSMTSLGRIGRILSGAAESHPNIREHCPPPASLSSREPSQTSDDQTPHTDHNVPVLAMMEPDVIASTKANSLKHSRAATASIVSTPVPVPGHSHTPVAPPRKKKRNKLHGSQTLSTADGDNLSICTQDTDEYYMQSARTAARDERGAESASAVLNASMALPSPASTIESLTREFQDSLELSQSKYATLDGPRCSGDSPLQSDRVRAPDSKDMRDLRGEMVRCVESVSTRGGSRTHSETRATPTANSLTRRSNSEGVGAGAGLGARRRSAGDETMARERAPGLTDIQILEQVTVLNLDTGERVPLSIAEHKLPQCINPLSLHIMRLTSEYIERSHEDNARETDEESESVCGGGGAEDAKETAHDTDGKPTAIKRNTAKLKRFFGSTVKKTVDAAKSLAQEVSHARHKEDVADIADDVRGEHNIKLKASNSHKGPYDFDGCVRHVQEMSGHIGAVWCCKFSVCGRLLATAGQDKLLRTWVTRDAYHLFQDMRTKYNAEQKSSPTPSQESLASLAPPAPAADHTAPLPPAAPFYPKPFCVYSGHTSDLLDVSWSKNYFLLSSSMDKTVRLWHISRGECLCCFQHIDFVTAIVFHPRDDRYFLSGSLDGKLRLWNIPDKKVAVWNEVDGKTKLITAANFCQNGKFAVVGTYDGRCIFYTTDQLKYHTQIDVRSTRGKNSTGRKISGIEPMPNDDKILVTSNDSRIRLYDLRDLNLSCKYKGYVNVSSQIKASFSHDGKYIVAGSENQCIYIWKTHHDYSKFSSVRRDRNDYWEGIKAHNALVTCAVFAPNPDHIIRMIHEREQEANDDSTERQTGESGLVSSSQTGQVLVSADFNGCIKVFVHKAKPKHSSLPASALA